MNKKILILHKLNNGLYQVKSYSDETMNSLAIFLEDGLDLDRYINYLKDSSRLKFYGNIIRMEKKGEEVVIIINEDIFPNMPIFITRIENVVKILNEFLGLVDQQVERIEITLDDLDQVTITGEEDTSSKI